MTRVLTGGTAARWIVTGLLSLLYLATGGAKLAGIPQLVESFHHFGYPDWFRLTIGATEVACAVLLWVPAVASYAAVLLGGIMIGAVEAHLRVGEPFAFPLILLFVLLAVAWVRRPARFRSAPGRGTQAPRADGSADFAG